MDVLKVADVWRAFRALENSYRYYGDAMAGIAHTMTGGFDAPAAPGTNITLFDTDPDMRPCYPPKCLIRPIVFQANVHLLAEKAMMLAVAVDALVATLPNPDGDVEFTASEQPGVSWVKS